MKLTRSEKCGIFTVYISGEEGKEVQAQIYQETKIRAETICNTQTQGVHWASRQLDELNARGALE